MPNLPDSLLLQARALINQAAAEAAAQGKSDIRALYFVTYPADDVTPDMIREAIDSMRQATPAGQAELHFALKPGRYVCWNCCGLRYEAIDGVGYLLYALLTLSETLKDPAGAAGRRSVTAGSGARAVAIPLDNW